MILGNSNRILLQGARPEVNEALETWKGLTSKTVMRSLPQKKTKIFQKAQEDMDQGFLDRQILWDLGLISTKQMKAGVTHLRGGEPLIEMSGVRVQYGDKVVLGNWKQEVNGTPTEGLHWTVRRGQRWAILGANGSGKTTLLSLITSDHPQAYAMPMKLFGRSRLPELGKPGISLFELQSRMGHSSPEIHAFFPRQLTIRAAVESAFAETFLSKPKLDYEKDLDITSALRFFKPELDPDAAVTTKADPPQVSSGNEFPKLSRTRESFIPEDYDVDYADNCTFGQLSTAQQRIILFLRAIIHKPDIIILDEAFSSMPASFRDKCINYLEIGEQGRNRSSTALRRTTSKDTWLKGFNSEPSTARFHGISDDQALIVISHVKEEIPDIVRNYMRLPSEDTGDGSEPLDFRLGMLQQLSSLSEPKVWDVAWMPKSEFMEHARRAWRKKSSMNDEENRDAAYYDWYAF